MTPKKKNVLRVGAMLLALCLMLAACNGTGTQNPTTGTTEQMTYQLQVSSEGGSPLADITVYIYADDTLEDLVAFAKTDKEGKASFTFNQGSYVAVLTGVPEGYVLEKSYPITGQSTQILLPVELVEGDLETVTYKLGDVMKDFSFTATDGTVYQLSQLLQEKKAVMLNFWFVNCGPCKAEFPHLQEAYTEYAENAIVLAMNPVDTDNSQIAAYARELGLTFPIGNCEFGWQKAMNIQGYPTTVVIDRFGTIALIHTGSIPEAQVFKNIFAFFTADDYTQTVVESVDDLKPEEQEEEVGTASTPVEISGVSSFKLTIGAGKTQHVNVHKMTNVWLQVKNKNISVEYNGKTYKPSNGTLGLMVSAPSTFDPARVIFTNNGTEEQTITVTLSSLPGSYSNPYTMQMGQFTTKVSAGNNQGVYFTYKAPEDGFFKLQCLKVNPEVAYDFSVMNLTTSAMRNMSTEGETDASTGNPVVTMPMNAGESLRIVISVLPDDSNNYPAASFTMLAAFTAGDVEDVVEVEKIPYAVTVTDENKNPLVGVSVNLTGTNDNKTTLVTDEKGVIAAYLEKDVYSGSVVIPAGYVATTSNFELTPELPMLSLKLDTYVVVYADYTVRVVDEAGNGVAGVLVTIGSTFGTTGEDGGYTVNLVKDTYQVTIGLPEGYTADSLVYDFPADSTVLGITVKEKQQEPEVTGLEYTVKVVDAAGNPMANVLVTFYQNETPVGMVPVDANGEAKLTLPAGDYTVKLTSADGSGLGHEASQAILSAEKTTTTITVATSVGGNSFEAAWWGNFYVLRTGSYQVDLSATINYSTDYECHMFVFSPGTSGVYRISVSDNAVLGYYGGINFPNGPSKSTDPDGYFELVIQDGEFANDNLPSYVLGAVHKAGQKQAVITITRTGDAPAELPVIAYQPTCQITPFTPSHSGKLTYVNIEGKATIEKKDDGFYYLNGKKLYINLSNQAPFITFSNMLGLVYNGGEWGEAATGTGMKGLVYEDSVVVGVEDFTQCMRDYIRASDPVSGLYPLNDDLIHMIQSCGAYMGWWNENSPNYLFESKSNLNAEIAWMFAVCYQ